MPRRKSNVNLTDARRLIRAFHLEGVDVRATLQPGGAYVFEPATSAGNEALPHEDLDRELAEFEERRGQG